MKNYIAVIITIIFLICPSVCFSSYLIELKNGSKFITYQYWKEGSQIKFYYSGGVVGIEKDLVREIRESDLPYIVEEPRPAIKEDAKAEAEYKPEPEQEKETRLLPHPEKEALLKEKMRITTEIDGVRAAFREAKAKNDSEQMQVEAKKLQSLKTELSRFRDRVKTAHGGVMPVWWDSQM
ncbi:MAG: hypothetical protein L6263_03960 [Desulfobacteraceae bacterium]|nr:hypothetical protein [Pseudomonadota bacterium]MBU4258113.1 hypothetical protein [Pseudomonadota bacterium]MCG2757568.1 hypothetical protein [Desulfobacteraceae bacterium]